MRSGFASRRGWAVSERLLAAAELGELLGLTAGTILDRFEAVRVAGTDADRSGQVP